MKFRSLMLKTTIVLLLIGCMPFSLLTANAAVLSSSFLLQHTDQVNQFTSQSALQDDSDCPPYAKTVNPSYDTATVNTYKAASVSTIPAPPGMPINTSSRKAIEVKPNRPVEGYLPPNMPLGCNFWPGGLWYKVTVDKPQKITGLLLTPPGLSYNLYVFYERSSSVDVTAAAASFRDSGPYQQVSYVVQPGNYYFFVTEYHTVGSLTQPFNLKVILSDTYDDYEQYYDDSPTTEAYQGSDINPMTHTIDNPYDEDWKMFNIEREGTVTLNLTNPSTKGAYRLDVVNTEEKVIATIYQNTTKTLRLPIGDYYVRVSAPNPSKYDPTVPYTISVQVNPDPGPVCDWDEDRPWEWVCTGP